MRLIFCLITGLLISSQLFAQQVLSLEEAIKIALNKNPELQRTSNNLESLNSDVKASFGSFLPSLGAQGNFEWNRSEEEGGFRSLPNGGVIYIGKSINETRSYSAGIGTNWVLFNGLSNYKNYEQSKTNLESGNLVLAQVKQDIVFQTISFYYMVVNNIKLLKVKEEDLVWNKKNLEDISERNKLGAITLNDVYAQQVRLGNAELELIKANNNLATSKSNLLYYLGLDVLDEYSFPDSIKVDNIKNEYDNEDIKQLAADALKNRFDVRSAKLDLESARLGVGIAKSSYYPTLTNNANFYTYSNKPGDLFKSKNYSIGLSLNIPIFSGFTTENQVQFAEVSYKNQEVVISELERDVKRKIQQTLLDLEAADKGLDVSEKNVIAAAENRKMEEEKYRIGSTTLLNVLIANSEYNNAQTNFINSQFSYTVLQEQLAYYIGVLDYKKFE